MNMVSFLRNPMSYIKSVPAHLQWTSFGAKYLTPKLKSVQIEPTNACHLRCEMCTSQVIDKESLTAKKGIMDMGLFESIIDQSTQLGVQAIGLNYSGEPLIHPEFKHMLKYAGSKKAFRIGFNTSADKLVSDIQDVVVEHCAGIGISMEGFQETHEKIRRGSSYDVVSSHVQELIDKRKSRNQTTPHVKLNLTKSSQTDEEIESFIDHWSQIVDCVQVNECYDSDYSLKVSFNEDSKNTVKSGRLLCHEPWHYMAILWDGRVTICCNDLRQHGLKGLNAKDMSIRDIWRSPVYKSVRMSQTNRQYDDPDFCKNCDEWVKHHVNIESRQNGYRTVNNGTNIRFYRAEDSGHASPDVLEKSSLM